MYFFRFDPPCAETDALVFWLFFLESFALVSYVEIKTFWIVRIASYCVETELLQVLSSCSLAGPTKPRGSGPVELSTLVGKKIERFG